jgi:pilus assembly protein Flp/PilA
MHTILKFIADESAATAIEYALIAGGISVAIIAGVSGLGTAVNRTYTLVSTSLK